MNPETGPDVADILNNLSSDTPLNRNLYLPSIECFYFIFKSGGELLEIGYAKNLRQLVMTRKTQRNPTDNFKIRSATVAWAPVSIKEEEVNPLLKKLEAALKPESAVQEEYVWDSKKNAYGVYIGRFSPFHRGHLLSVLSYLNKVNHLIIFVGSTERARDIKNPFTFEEREMMIRESLKSSGIKSNQYTIVSVPDIQYNDYYWQSRILAELSLITKNHSDVTLFGHNKDASSYYLSIFENAINHVVLSESLENGISATQLREAMFTNPKVEVGKESTNLLIDFLPPEVFSFIVDFLVTPEGENLVEEYAYIQEYKKTAQTGLYPVQFITVDAFVYKSGHVLMVERAGVPGKGLYALPGGFIQDNETVMEGTLRELKEETSLSMLPGLLRAAAKKTVVFDHPQRSLRGRVMSHTTLFDLGDGGLLNVKGSDDAARAFWVSTSEIMANPHMYFEDHWDIIQNMLQFVERRY